MGVLARVFEAAGMATVGLSLVRRQAENIKAPRFLHCEFPLGRPLGKPADAEFQLGVLRRAFSLLDRIDVPVIEDHPDVIDDDSGEAAACTLPPRHDPSLHPAVDEATGLIPAYSRQVASADGRTAFGRIATIETLGDHIMKLVSVAEGATLADVRLDADGVRALGQDLRAFYEEAGLAIADHVPAARQIETWFYTQTQTGPIIAAAARALQEAGEDRNTWYYLLPGSQQ